MNWETIFRDAVPSIAGVTVYDKGSQDILGRYVVAKTMKLPTGKIRTHQTYYAQRPAALAYAARFLAQRAALTGKEYTPGDGSGTIGFSPIPKERIAA